jgi:SHS2 domain-containing protein
MFYLLLSFRSFATLSEPLPPAVVFPLPALLGIAYDQGMVEFFEHTADLGIRVRASDFNALLIEAARGLFSAIVDDLETVRPEQRIDVEVTGTEPELLLFDWLNELLFRFDTEHLVFGRFEVRSGEGKVTGSAQGEPLDRSRHEINHEVKAITYHGLRVEHQPEGWLAEVIVDI